MRCIAILLAMTISTTAFAQTASEPTALSPGKPAGVHQAQMAMFGTNTLLIVAGVAAVAAGIAIAASSHKKAAAAGTTTTTTGTAP